MKKKKVIVPMMIIDDSQYKDEPVNRNPNSTLIKMTPEIQKEKDRIEKVQILRGCNKIAPNIVSYFNTLYNKLKW